MDLISPVFLSGVAAATIIGIGKGGFGGVGTVVAVPIMSLFMPPHFALGVLLPVLMLADLISVTCLWRHLDREAIVQALPGAIVGVIVGMWLLTSIDGAPAMVVIGCLSILFAAYSLMRALAGTLHSAGPLGSRRVAPWFGLACGVTSTLAHAGGPPIHIHLLGRGYTPIVFAATATVFMAVVNIVKLGPFLWVGTIDRETLLFSLKLVPIGAVAALVGVWVAHRISRNVFSLIVNILMFCVGVQLVYVGITDMMSP